MEKVDGFIGVESGMSPESWHCEFETDGTDLCAILLDVELLDGTVEKRRYVPERTCHIEERHGDWYCTGCGEMVGTDDPTSELFVDGNAIDGWKHCPNCGAKVVSE